MDQIISYFQRQQRLFPRALRVEIVQFLVLSVEINLHVFVFCFLSFMAPLFTEVTPNGRRQQLEGAAIILCHQCGHDDQACHLAIRMFAQDEYLLDSSFVPAAETLLEIAKVGEIMISTKMQNELRTMLQNQSRNPMEFLTMETF